MLGSQYTQHVGTVTRCDDDEDRAVVQNSQERLVFQIPGGVIQRRGTVKQYPGDSINQKYEKKTGGWMGAVGLPDIQEAQATQ